MNSCLLLAFPFSVNLNVVMSTVSQNLSWALETLTLPVHPRHPVQYTTIFSYWKLQLYWSREVTSTDSHHSVCHGSNFDWQCDHWLCWLTFDPSTQLMFCNVIDHWLYVSSSSQLVWLLTAPFWPLTFQWFGPVWHHPFLHGSETWPLSRSTHTVECIPITAHATWSMYFMEVWAWVESQTEAREVNWVKSVLSHELEHSRNWIASTARSKVVHVQCGKEIP